MLAPETHNYAKIRVVGVGGGGGNAITRMIESGVTGVEFLAINTDAQALDRIQADNKLQIGVSLTKGLGAGGDPQIGRAAAEESKQEIMMALDGSDMVFLTCGLGGGTGTGASPVVAEIARSLGALTVAICTRPFQIEGPRRKANADDGFNHLKENVDAIVVIPNDRLISVVEKRTTLAEAFQSADDILRQGVQGISEVIVIPGLINLDFADVRAVLANAGTALMGIGVGQGEHRAPDAAKIAVSSPLLEQTIDGAEAILFNITGPADLGLNELQEAAEIITSSTKQQNPNVLMGAVIDERMQNEVRITVVATGFDRKPSVPTASTPRHGTQEGRLPSAELSVPQRASLLRQAYSGQPPTVSVQLPDDSRAKPAGQLQDDTRRGPAFPSVAQPVQDDDLDIPAFLRRK
ncbi:MAG TPA: cell division protein FtsZ [Armatimonadota bacterium]|nr:cell division protein FtsZ [Armatimonadota bacterium]HQK94817.1 cell division protein FtsZ [Armatimonadota bacterium]